MEESFENKLLEVDLLDIYDDIAGIDISPDEVIKICTTFNCKVNLQVGNVVYAIEKKYKNKLAKYKQEKRLKWLRLNLKAIMPNPEEKLLKWEQTHTRNKRLSWMKRKMLALDYFANESLVYYSEEPCCSHSILNRSERRLSQSVRKRAHFTPDRNVTHENSLCTSTDNTSMESVETVIASQPRNTQESSDIADYSPLIHFKDVSRSILSSSSGNLPSLCSEGASTPNKNEAEPKKDTSVKEKVKSPEKVKTIAQLVQESEGLSSQEDPYMTFYQDTKVTSTQEMSSL